MCDKAKRDHCDLNCGRWTVDKISLRGRVCLAFLGIIRAIVLFLAPQRVTIEKLQPERKVIINKYESAPYGGQLLGTGLLLLSVWLFRKELGLKSLGPFSGEEVPLISRLGDDLEGGASLGNTGTEKRDLPTPSTPSAPAKTSEIQKDQIMDLIGRLGRSTNSRIAKELSVSISQVESAIDELAREGKVEKIVHIGRLGKQTIYADPESFENRSIIEVIEHISEREQILAVTKFAQVKGREIDAIVETKDVLYLMEIKNSAKHLEFAVDQLQAIRNSLIADRRFWSKSILGIAAAPGPIDPSLMERLSATRPGVRIHSLAQMHKSVSEATSEA